MAFRRGIFKKAAHQGPRPASGTGQGNGHEDHQAQVLVFGHLAALDMGLLFQLVHQGVQPGHVAAHPEENAPDIHQNKGKRENIAHNAGGKGHPGVQPQGHAEGNAAPQLDDGEHGDQHGKDDLAALLLGEPSHQIQNGFLQVLTKILPEGAWDRSGRAYCTIDLRPRDIRFYEIFPQQKNRAPRTAGRPVKGRFEGALTAQRPGRWEWR